MCKQLPKNGPFNFSYNSHFRIGNVSELPDAYKRLADCESKFVASYGANLERVKAVKGHAGEESVLLVRMHLLQVGI